MEYLSAIIDFLACRTPQAWCQNAALNLDILLIDHAHCEKKAASNAINLLFRYADKEEMVVFLSRLAREELRHFEKVIRLLKRRNIPYSHLTPCRYANSLRQYARTKEPERLVDILLICAFIEARSCERFASVATFLDEEVGEFYSSLALAESRHFEEYLRFARLYSPEPLDTRITFFAEIERQTILANDDQFRFHSGIPIITECA